MSFSPTVLAVQAVLIRDGLSAAEARALLTRCPGRMAWIETMLEGKSIDLGSRHVAALAHDLRDWG